MGRIPRRRIGRVLTAHFLDRWEQDETQQLLLRTATTNQAAVERMQAIFAGQLLPVVTDLHPPPISRAEIAQRAGLALCRYVLRFPPVVGMDRDTVLDWVAPTIQRYLTGTPG